MTRLPSRSKYGAVKTQLDGSDDVYRLKTCTECGGSGQRGGLDDWPCSTCDGDGLVWVSDDEEEDE